MEKSLKIADIIVAFITGKATPEQITILDKWVSESEANKQLFLSLLDESIFKQRLEEQKKNDMTIIFQQIQKKRQALLRHRRIHYAVVAASIAIIMTFGGIWTFQFILSNKEKILTPQECITMGKSKAVLTLASGEKIVMDKQDTVLHHQITNIRIQNQGQISYQVTDSLPSSEIEYNLIETPRGGEFQLQLSDGTKVWLNAETKLRYPIHLIGKERRVELSGEAYFDVTENKNVPFIVETSQSEITVLGTEFCIRDYTGQINRTTLVRGRVAVKDRQGKSHVIKPGQQVNINKDKVEIIPVETFYFTSWKDGYFMFNKVSLNHIMNELSKWYDFDYCFADTTIANTKLTARLKKYDEIDRILDILSRTGDVNFTQQGRSIIVENK